MIRIYMDQHHVKINIEHMVMCYRNLQTLKGTIWQKGIFLFTLIVNDQDHSQIQIKSKNTMISWQYKILNKEQVVPFYERKCLLM